MTDQTFRIWKNYSILFLFLWLTSNFFPGSYNVDTWYQFFEMVSWDYSDWHSPFTGLLWRPLYVYSDRFFSLYIFQMAWYFLFFHVLSNLIVKRWVVILGLLVSIYFIFIPQYMMKDVLMTLSWCSALIMLLVYDRDQKNVCRIFAFIFIAYGLLLRPNALPAALPLLFMWFDTFIYFRTKKLLKYLSTFIAGCLVFAFYYLVLHGFLHAKPGYFTYKYSLADVLGISMMSGENFMPECITSKPIYDKKRVEELYTPATNDNIYFAADTMIPWPTAELDACLKESWVKAIKKHPFIYLKSRAIGYIYYLKLVNRMPREAYWNVTVSVIKNNSIPIDDHHTPLTKKLLRLWKATEPLFLFDPWFWLLLNCILTFLFYRKYKQEKLYFYKLQIALQVACIIYQLAQFPVYQIDLDFRFSYLNVISFFTGLLFYLGGFRKKISPEDPDKQKEQLPVF